MKTPYFNLIKNLDEPIKLVNSSNISKFDEEFDIPPPSRDTASLSLDDVLLDDEWSEDAEVAFAKELRGDESPLPSTTSIHQPPPPPHNVDDDKSGSLLKCVFLQGISQQITNTLERIDAGVGCAVAAWGDRVAIGTSHGYVLAFSCQVLRWCCQQNKDQAAVTSLDYSEDGSRLLAGFARGIVCMYESDEGSVLRKVEACGGGPWGVLRVCWIPIGAGPRAAVVADTGGSIWLLRFTRTLAIRSTKVSCLFSGARGEVCAIEPLNKSSDRWGGVLALATLSRVVVVWGVSGASGARPRAGCQAFLVGPPDSLPLLAWQPAAGDSADVVKRLKCPIVLCSARGVNIQFHQIRWGTSGPKMMPLKSPKPLAYAATAIRWLGTRRLAILDSRETLFLWETSANTIVDVLDLSNAQLVYANAYFKGVATDGKVSEALARAGAEALGGSITNEYITGALLLLGRTGLTRITARTTLAAAHHHADMGRWVKALETVVYRYKSLDGFANLQTCLTQRSRPLFLRLAKNAAKLLDHDVALATIDSCVRMELLDTLWGPIWDGAMDLNCGQSLILCACKKASEGSLPWIAPSALQEIVNYMLKEDPQTLQKALLHLPIACMDLHQVLSECRRMGLWSAWVRVTAATAPDDPALPIRDLISLVGVHCKELGDTCPGDVLLLYTADCFAGRIFPMGSVSIADRPMIGQEVLRCLLYDPVDEMESSDAKRLPHLRALLIHDLGSTLRMLEMSFSTGPFSGPLGKQKRLAMGLALHNILQTSNPDEFTEEEIAEIVSFTCNRLVSGSLPPDITLIGHIKTQFSHPFSNDKANKIMEASWLMLLKSNSNITNHLPLNEMLEMAHNTGRLKVKRFLKESIGEFDGILETFLNDPDSETEMFLYLEKYSKKEERLITKQVLEVGRKLAMQWPEHTARFLLNFLPELIPAVLPMIGNEDSALQFTTFLRKQEALDSELAAKHLELLCLLKPDSIMDYLNDPPATLSPNVALALIRKHDIRFAEPKCLECTGDLNNALNSAIKLMNDSESREDRQKFAEEAYSLCTRAVKLSGPEEAERFWRQFVESVSLLPDPLESPLPALLLESAAHYLPLAWLVAKICHGHGGREAGGALRGALVNLVTGTKDNAEAMAAAARLTGAELHTALAVALRRRRCLAIPATACGHCHRPLQSHARAYACGHAFHVDCDPPPVVEEEHKCGKCGAAAKEVRKRVRGSGGEKTAAQAKTGEFSQSLAGEQSQSFSLRIVAPPRPDLEGVI